VPLRCTQMAVLLSHLSPPVHFDLRCSTSFLSGPFYLKVITNREEASPLMVATNLPFGEWSSIFVYGRLAVTVVDRITYRSKILETGIESYRLKSARKKG
ncbi:ATP-binding protein, partial [Ferrithrix thermotolerans]|uniref:ATP-binding protein n=1 Tax=Ferrithrix thermotolerans TaxID=209649 RepID=UPI001C49E40C